MNNQYFDPISNSGSNGNGNNNVQNRLDRSATQPHLPIHTIVKKLADSTGSPQPLAIPNDIPTNTPNVKELGKVFETTKDPIKSPQSSPPLNKKNININNSNKISKQYFATEKISNNNNKPKPIPDSFYINQKKDGDSNNNINHHQLDSNKKSNSDSNIGNNGSGSGNSSPSNSFNSNVSSSQSESIITPTTSPRNLDKSNFTQGSTANFDKGGRKKNFLIGHTRETPPSSPSSISPSSASPAITTPTATSPSLSSSPSNVDDVDVKYLEKKFNSKRFQNTASARKSILTRKDAEWIEKELIVNSTTNSTSTLANSLINNNSLINSSTTTSSSMGSSATTSNSGGGTSQQPSSSSSSAKESHHYRESIRPGYKRDDTIASSHDSDDIDIYESPCFRFIEEVGKKKSISAEPCRRPGIKTPMFLNVPTLAMPTQFHQQPPERLSSSTFSTSAEENSYPESALLFNQQIINRVSYDKELSYLFFPILKQSTLIVNQSSPLANSINTNTINNQGNNNNNNSNKIPHVIGSNNSSNSSTPPQHQISGGGSSCDLYSLSPSPSSSPIETSSSIVNSNIINSNSNNSNMTNKEMVNKDTNRKSYFPMISLGKSNKNQPSQPNQTPSSPSSITSSFSSSTSTPPLSPSNLEQSFANTNSNNNNNNTNEDNSNTNNNNNNNNSLTNNSVGSNTSGSSPTNNLIPSLSKDNNGLPQQLDISKIVSDEFSDRTDMIFCQFSNIRNRYKLKSSSLDGLIEILTHHKFSEPGFVDTFLLTYKTFTTPPVVLAKLIEKYEYDPSSESNNNNNNSNKKLTTQNGEENEEDEEDLEMKEKLQNSRTVKLRVVSILKIWVDKHFNDFERNEEILLDIINFIEGPLVQDGMEKVSQNILRTIERKRERGFGSGPIEEDLAREKNLIHFKIPPPIIPQILKADQILSIHNFDDLEIARQLTLIEHESYSLIKTRECTHLAFSKLGKEENAPNIVHIIKRSNLIPLWVATEIVQEERITKRSNIIKKFISIADHCRNLNNFNAVMEILSGLNLTPVYRLKKTWETLPRKYLATFKHLNSLMAPKNNFKVYREVLHSKNPPCLPFLGLYLTDLTFIEEATPDIIDNGLINMVKRSHQSSVIKEIQQFQQLPYSFTPVPIIRDFILQINGLQERALYKQSKIIEP